ncbi:nucleotidyltransferase family protein [Cytobacillus solani]|uniref:nucleotidyltransferase family protein n=1 Tax=Cytobacillus solani TaxID=1637975 RepID=UPI003CCBB748
MIKERFCEKNEEKLVEIISNSYQLKRLFEILKESNIPFNYYIGAGCITNTIWNHLSGYPLTYGISDVDVVYFDNKDLSLTSEQKFTDYLVINWRFSLSIRC